MSAPARSRREVLGLAAGGAGLAAGTGSLLLGAANALADEQRGEREGPIAAADGDSEILEILIGLEQRAVLTYDAIAGTRELGRRTRGIARGFARQERAHTELLATALDDLGGEPPGLRREPGDVPGLERALRKGRAAVARFAITLETETIRSYYEALGVLGQSRLLMAATEIMASDAQHLVVLRQVLGRNPSPDAFVTGR